MPMCLAMSASSTPVELSIWQKTLFLFNVSETEEEEKEKRKAKRKRKRERERKREEGGWEVRLQAQE